MMNFKHKTRIKICGITNREDAETAVELGADALGFVFASSPRKIGVKKAQQIISQLPPFVIRVGVFMNQPMDLVINTIKCTKINVIQLHGKETREYCRKISQPVIKRIAVKGNESGDYLMSVMKGYDVTGFILDPGAGSGEKFKWDIISKINQPLIIAGGLTPENVGRLVQQYHPYAVDVSSGVEMYPGKKDKDKIKKFIKEVRGC